jgi:hypothetical protein
MKSKRACILQFRTYALRTLSSPATKGSGRIEGCEVFSAKPPLRETLLRYGYRLLSMRFEHPSA